MVRFLNKCERGLSAKYNSKKIKNEKKSNILRIFRPSANLKAFEKIIIMILIIQVYATTGFFFASM